MEHSIAKAIRIIQEGTGCRVLLEPMMGSEAPKVAAEAPKKAVKMAPVNAEHTPKKARKKAAKKAETPETYLSVAKFAEMVGAKAATIYSAISAGRISQDMIRKNDKGNLEVNSRLVGVYSHGAGTPRPVECIETGSQYPSITAASSAMKISYPSILKSMKNGVAAKGFHFKPL